MIESASKGIERVGRLNLALSAGAAAAGYALVSPHFALSLAAGAAQRGAQFADVELDPERHDLLVVPQDGLEVRVHLPEAGHRRTREVVGSIGRPERQRTRRASEDARRGRPEMRGVPTEPVGRATR